MEATQPQRASWRIAAAYYEVKHRLKAALAALRGAHQVANQPKAGEPTREPQQEGQRQWPDSTTVKIWKEPDRTLTRTMVEEAARRLSVEPLEPSFNNKTVHFTNAAGKPLATKRVVAEALGLGRQSYYTQDADKPLSDLGYRVFVARRWRPDDDAASE